MATYHEMPTVAMPMVSSSAHSRAGMLWCPFSPWYHATMTAARNPNATTTVRTRSVTNGQLNASCRNWAS